MSYSYRKKKRIEAHRILKLLKDQQIIALNENNAERAQVKIASLGNSEDDNFDFYPLVLGMLRANQHIKSGQIHAAITVKGIDAYNESYYHVENRKDYLESIEYITKWIIPVISIIISVSAFVISIFVLIHTWNKK